MHSRAFDSPAPLVAVTMIKMRGETMETRIRVRANYELDDTSEYDSIRKARVRKLYDIANKSILCVEPRVRSKQSVT